MLIITIAMATILAYAAHLLAGRLVGMGITTLCSGIMAYFLMPPVYSLRVSQKHDLVVLGLYTMVGLVLSRTTPSKTKRAATPVDAVHCHASGDGRQTHLSTAVADLMSSDLGIRLRTLGLVMPGDTFLLPCTRRESQRILTNVLTAVLEDPAVQRIWICGGQRPGHVPFDGCSTRRLAPRP